MPKILIAEDDKFLANAYRVKLTKEGFDIEIAENGIKALEIVEKSQPDLILLDLVMPKKDGFSTLKDLKANEKWKNIPVIVSTNLSQEEDREKIMEMGANDFIIKSELSMESLIKKINDLKIETKTEEEKEVNETSKVINI